MFDGLRYLKAGLCEVILTDHHAPHAGAAFRGTGHTRAKSDVAAVIIDSVLGVILVLHEELPVVGGILGSDVLRVIPGESILIGHCGSAGIVIMNTAVPDDIRQILGGDHSGEVRGFFADRRHADREVYVEILHQFLDDLQILIGGDEIHHGAVRGAPQIQRHTAQIRITAVIAGEKSCPCASFLGKSRHTGQSQHHSHEQ